MSRWKEVRGGAGGHGLCFPGTPQSSVASPPPLPAEGLPEGLPWPPHPFSLSILPLSLTSSPPCIKCSLRAPLLSLPVGTAFITVRLKQLFF